MPENTLVRSWKLRIIAQDPGIQSDRRILTAEAEVPAEVIGPGPWGHRVHVIDYDASTQTLYAPVVYENGKDGILTDPFASATDQQLLNNPQFHMQNVYAIVMRTLARFEYALGRRVSWGFNGHQLKVAPHAFADANAFYSKEDEALMFGYFPGKNGQTVFSCLSHDVVVHETTHALVDGLRERYTDPSSSDQAGFHEGISDVVALLSVFSLREVVGVIIDTKHNEERKKFPQKYKKTHLKLISLEALGLKEMQESVLFGLADEMGEELSKVRGQPLRASLKLPPSPKWYLEDDEFKESHRRGEILVAAMLKAFLKVWIRRLQALDPMGTGWLDRDRVVEEGALAADRLLTMAIRALDYSPPVHLLFGDYLSALLTADYELHPDDSKYQFRKTLLASFKAYGIGPTSEGSLAEPGIWSAPESEANRKPLNYSRTHFESMLRDREEVFRFIWENQAELRLCKDAFTRVLSVRPCLRIAQDGFALRETVAEYMQVLRLTAPEIARKGIKVEGLPPEPREIQLYGGGVLLFDEYGRVKFHVHNRVDSFERQRGHLQALVDYGYFKKGMTAQQQFAHVHRLRARNAVLRRKEGWY